MQLLLEESVKMDVETVEEKQQQHKQQQKPQEVSFIQIDSFHL